MVEDGAQRKKQTDELEAEQSGRGQRAVTYAPFPHPSETAGRHNRPVWRVLFDLEPEAGEQFGLSINGDIVLGRGSQEPNILDLNPYHAAELGVSRRHALLRPTPTALYVVDLGSTNGTLRNGQTIGVNTPFSLTNGDRLTLGKLQLVVRIMERPSGQSELLAKADLQDAMAQVAKAITSQRELDEVLTQVVEAARALTNAEETSIWLMEETSGELFLEAQQGIEDEEVKRMRLQITADTLVGEVFTSGEPIRARREPGEKKIQVKEHYTLESVVYTPLKLGGMTFGVLSSAHRSKAETFSERDEQMLEAIADFAAIAVANARLFAALEQERSTVHATVDALDQPLMILDENGVVLISNTAADELLKLHHEDLLHSLQGAVGETRELEIAARVYLATVERAQGVGTIIVMQDITYVKQLEKDREEFVQALSHDLKSPLTSIRGWAHLIEKVGALNEKSEGYVENIVDTTKRMTEQINQLVRSASIPPEVRTVREACSLLQIVEKVAADVKGAALGRDIELHVDIDGEPYEIEGDKERLYHMLLNVVDNAVKYSPDHSEVGIVVTFNSDMIQIIVTDEGSGIPEEDQERVFDKYYRVDKSSEQASGAGLGLSVVKAAVEMHGGVVSARNREQGGAVFDIKLPSRLRIVDD